MTSSNKLFINARLEAACFTPGQLLPPDQNIPEIAFAGRSNVGKSSLINALLNTKLAKTGQTPGKTRSINFYHAEINPSLPSLDRDGAITEQVAPDKGRFRGVNAFRLVDLPGYGYAARSKTERNEWRKLTSAYMRDREVLKLVCHLVDFRHGLLANDRELQEYINSTGKNIFVIFTKADKIAHGKWKSTRDKYILERLYSVNVPIITSSDKLQGIKELSDFLAEFIKAN